MTTARGCRALGLFALVLTATRTPAQSPAAAGGTAPPPGRVLRDEWSVASLNGRRAGYSHLTVAEVPSPNGAQYLRATRELKVSVRRADGAAELTFVAVTDELPDGQV